MAKYKDVTHNRSPKFPSRKLCMFCDLRKPIAHWGDAMSMVHGGAIDICRVCVLEKQIEHAEERARILPELKQELADILAKEKNEV